MTSHQRLDAVFTRSRPDRTPVLGGWIACPEHICELAGIDEKTYWRDPQTHSMEAYRRLGADGLIALFVPKNRSDYRCVDAHTYQRAQTAMTLQEALEYVDRLPEPAEIEKKFDLEQEYRAFSGTLREYRQRCGKMLWLPAQWSIAARVNWYGELGYENFFCIVGAYPDHARRLMEVGGARGYCRSLMVARAVGDGLYPKALLFGEDICTQRGPMISPTFMSREYAPHLARGLKPLLDAGCMPVWHSDGDVRPIMDMLIECGVQGFQGFQPECGMLIEEVVERKTREGNNLIIFGPLSVTGELPRMTPSQVTARVHAVIDLCEGRAHLVLFTANTINPDVPLENIRAMHDAVNGQWESTRYCSSPAPGG